MDGRIKKRRLSKRAIKCLSLATNIPVGYLLTLRHILNYKRVFEIIFMDYKKKYYGE
jgi:hypothetical protein